MSSTTFLSNESLWSTLTERIKKAQHVDAAIAYFASGGAKLLPLKKGDRLVVDMSLAAVTAGATDPTEVEKLFRRGVSVFTRRNLHAKILIADNAVISGSANVSKHSQTVLDEAALLTNDRSAVRRAREFIDRLCTEPVREEYVRECKVRYRPPRSSGRQTTRKGRERRVAHAKLWIVNLQEYDVPESETERFEKGTAKASEKRSKDEAHSTIESFHWPRKPKMADELEFGDWVIQALTHADKTISVYPPGQLLFIDHYVRDKVTGKERWVFHLEVPKRRETLSWPKFRRAANRALGNGKMSSPRTRPVRDIASADSILTLWTPSGRISRR